MATAVDIQTHMTKAQAMGLENGRVAAGHCTSPSYFRCVDTPLLRALLMFGRVDELANPGDHILRKMPALNANFGESKPLLRLGTGHSEANIQAVGGSAADCRAGRADRNKTTSPQLDS